MRDIRRQILGRTKGIFKRIGTDDPKPRQPKRVIKLASLLVACMIVSGSVYGSQTATESKTGVEPKSSDLEEAAHLSQEVKEVASVPSLN
jgi:hypothetical protein